MCLPFLFIMLSLSFTCGLSCLEELFISLDRALFLCSDETSPLHLQRPSGHVSLRSPASIAFSIIATDFENIVVYLVLLLSLLVVSSPNPGVKDVHCPPGSLCCPEKPNTYRPSLV